MYREWRNANNNQKPDRAIVKMYWEDESQDNTLVDTIALRPYNEMTTNDDAYILWYASGLRGLLELLKPGNGSDFIVTEILEFYKK